MHSKRLITQTSGIHPHLPASGEGGRQRAERAHTWDLPHFLNCTSHQPKAPPLIFLLPSIFHPLSLLSHQTALAAILPSFSMVLLDPAAMHRRTATFDLPSPRIGRFSEPEPYSPQFFPPVASSSSKFNTPRITISQFFISRQWLQRTTFLALFSLFSVSVYILLLNGSSNLQQVAVPQQIKSPFQAAMKTIAHSNDRPWRPTHKDVLASRPQITLSPEEELAALSSFIISLPDQNILPPSVDPSQPIDPQLILDFDTRADGAEAELKRLVAATWETYPVVMYTKVLTFFH